MKKEIIDKLVNEVLAVEQEEAYQAGAIGYMARALIQATIPITNENAKNTCNWHPKNIELLIGKKNALISSFEEFRFYRKGDSDGLLTMSEAYAVHLFFQAILSGAESCEILVETILLRRQL